MKPRKVNQMKIAIPDNLRERIENVLKSLPARLTEHAATRAALESEREALTAESGKLAGEITALEASALHDNKAMDSLVRSETRLRLAKARLMELAGEIDNFPPVQIRDVADLLTDIVRFYTVALPAQIVEALRPVCPNEVRALQLARLTDASAHVAAVSRRAANMPFLPVNASVIAGVEQILRRALAGRPLLLRDTPQDAGETQCGSEMVEDSIVVTLKAPEGGL